MATDGLLSHIGALSARCSSVLTPRAVVFAGHCGSEHSDLVASDGSELTLSECQVHPDAGLGNGFDIGYCPISGPGSAEPALVATSEPVVGTTVYFAGLGNVLVGERAGRVLAGRVVAVGRELAVDFDGAVLLPGDSGGGLFADCAQGPCLVGIASSSWQPRGRDAELARFVPIQRANELRHAVEQARASESSSVVGPQVATLGIEDHAGLIWPVIAAVLLACFAMGFGFWRAHGAINPKLR